jgi:acyl-CoA synthetase (NDP forming)
MRENPLVPDVRPLLFPRSLAVVGATPRRPEVMANVQRGGARVWGVSPRHAEVLGVPCAASLAALPERPELALMLVSHERLEALVEEALALGIRAFVVPGLGAEAGTDGPPVAARVAGRAREAGAAVLGPNCMGTAVPGGSSTWTGSLTDAFLPGGVAAVCQSGSIGDALRSLGPRIGFRCVVSTGGEAVTDAADLLDWLADDDGTAVVALFLETVRRPGAFAAALERCAEADKPVVCLKVGRSEAAARAALTHTGALVGSDRAFDAALRRFGAIRVGDFHELVETLELLAAPRRPRGRRLAAVSESGGECALLADHADEAGISFQPLPDRLAAALRAEFPNFLAPQNPLDVWAVADENVVYPRTLDLLARSGEFDVLVAQVDLSRYRGASEEEWTTMVVRSLAAAVQGTEAAPVVASVHATDPPPALAAEARALGVPLLRGTREAAAALAGVTGRRPVRRRAPPRSYEVSDLLAPGALPEHESSRVLERCGVPFAPRRRATTPAEAAEAAEALGPPVVVKLDGPAHKARLGGVVKGVETPAGAADAARRLGCPVLVAREIPAGSEAFCGMTRDEGFGPVLAVGPGGAGVEQGARVALSLAPLDRESARELVLESGLRQAVDALADALVVIGDLALSAPEIASIDVNPLILNGEAAIAVDALVVVTGG